MGRETKQTKGLYLVGLVDGHDGIVGLPGEQQGWILPAVSSMWWRWLSHRSVQQQGRDATSSCGCWHRAQPGLQGIKTLDNKPATCTSGEGKIQSQNGQGSVLSLKGKIQKCCWEPTKVVE